jgi:hypothetical protein
MHTQLLETLVQQQHVNQKMPPTKGRPLQRKMKHDVARLKANGLRSNAMLLELYKLDIGSTCNNPWVRWPTLIGISLVLLHHSQWKWPSLHRQEVLQLHKRKVISPSMLISTKPPWKLYPSRVKKTSRPSNHEDTQDSQSCWMEFSELRRDISGRQYALNGILK